jgi:tRNA pseudouridine38-40 synthase
VRLAMGLQYDGQAFSGWQHQPGSYTVQDQIQQAICRFTGVPVTVTVAGRTDAGVHALGQVIHFDTHIEREMFSWVRGTNAFLPKNIAVQWAQVVPDGFHARFSAIERCYFYALYTGPHRVPLLAGRAGYYMLPPGKYLNTEAMRIAARYLEGKHDFSAFRAAQCQAKTATKTLYELHIKAQGPWVFCRIRANAFLYHMVRNIMGSLIAIGTGRRVPEWMLDLLKHKDRRLAAPTFMPDGLYLASVTYPEQFTLPNTDFSASIFQGAFS